MRRGESIVFKIEKSDGRCVGSGAATCNPVFERKVKPRNEDHRWPCNQGGFLIKALRRLAFKWRSLGSMPLVYYVIKVSSVRRDTLLRLMSKLIRHSVISDRE